MASSAKDLTECSVCLEDFRDPQKLPCDHTFCRSCVDRIEDSGNVKCPMCNQVCFLSDIKSDFRLAQFLDVLTKQTKNPTMPPAAAAAVAPVAAKESHITAKEADTTTAKEADAHEATAISDPPSSGNCQVCEHRALYSFCHGCEKWMCAECKLKESAAHKHTILTEKADEIRQMLGDQLNALKNKLTDIAIHKRRLDTIVKHSAVNRQQTARTASQGQAGDSQTGQLTLAQSALSFSKDKHLTMEADTSLIKAQIEKLKKAVKLRNLEVLKNGNAFVQDAQVMIDLVSQHIDQITDMHVIDMFEQLMPDVHPTTGTQEPSNQQVSSVSDMDCVML